ncbi:MAG: hypothetical protein ACXWE7_11750, partial [Nitrososphaeraceae archaeon]
MYTQKINNKPELRKFRYYFLSYSILSVLIFTSALVQWIPLYFNNLLDFVFTVIEFLLFITYINTYTKDKKGKIIICFCISGFLIAACYLL